MATKEQVEDFLKRLKEKIKVFDIIAADDLEKRVTFYEVKRQRDELDMKVLEEKMQRFKEVTGEYGKYETDIAGLCMEDM